MPLLVPPPIPTCPPQLRRHVRESLTRVKLAASVVQRLSPAPGSGARPMPTDNALHAEPSAWHRQRDKILQLPQCVAMHVRNNDVGADRSAGDSANFDR